MDICCVEYDNHRLTKCFLLYNYYARLQTPFNNINVLLLTRSLSCLNRLNTIKYKLYLFYYNNFIALLLAHNTYYIIPNMCHAISFE